MMSGHVRVALAGLLAGTTLTACGTGAANAAPKVTAAFYPLQWLTEQVAGPDIKVTGLTAPGVEPHDIELSAQQVATLQDSSLTVYIKGLQPAVDEAVGQQQEDKSFDAASAVKTLQATTPDEHAAYDPHLWLDPARLATVATELGKRLGAADPDHAQAYEQRAAETTKALTTLDQEMAKGLSSCSSKTMVTSHEAFGYLADRYHLKQVGITLDPETEPSPARIAEVAKLAMSERVTTIFTESLVSPKVAEVLAKEVGARTAVLDPLESKPAHGDYLSEMRQNLKTIRTALGCS
ncbi:metal ABC transporter substrate-binding protein [Nonomuraea sp. NPDC050556]|uniref:metal ABC transporter substrate-binding protein n=1 Tax=Nonomuraea sp. NPDC050556 TaxID=3364369 RepID=UPI00378F7ADA